MKKYIIKDIEENTYYGGFDGINLNYHFTDYFPGAYFFSTKEEAEKILLTLPTSYYKIEEIYDLYTLT